MAAFGIIVSMMREAKQMGAAMRSEMKGILAISAVFSLVLFAVPAVEGAAAVEPPPFRSVVLGVRGFLDDEYDFAFERLGWPVTKFSLAKGEAADDAFFAALKEAGLLLICPNAPDFLSPRVAELKAWIEEGGVVLAGGFTEPSSAAWLKVIGTAYACPEIWGNLGWSTPRQRELTPPDPLRVFPRPLAETDQGHHWTNFQRLPAGSPWRTVSTRIAAHREANGHPNVIRARVGKGWVILSNIRTPTPDWIENARALAALESLGLTFVSCEGLSVGQGAGRLALSVAGGKDAKAKKLSLALDILPRSGADEDQDGKPDAPQSFRAVGRSSADGKAAFALDYFNAARGECRVVLRIGANGKWATVLDETRHFPRLVEIAPPNYRGMVSAARRTTDVLLPFSFNPLRERVENARLEATLFAADGKHAVWQKTFRGAKLKEKALAVGLPQTAAPGEYRLALRLMRPNRAKPLFTNEVAFAIRAAAPHQTFVDQDGTLLRGGKPWFPLGIYHAGPDEAAEWMKMGFNSQQFWSWDAGGLAALHKDWGLSVVFEGKHNKGEGVVEGLVRKYATDPAVAMWYLWDEPTTADLPKVRAMEARMHGDLDRPTFIVCDQATLGAVRFQSLYGDVVAVDSYPISVKDGEVRGDVMEVPARIRRLREATEGRRPVVAVLQAFGCEPKPQFRCMAYLALAEGVNGIYWYCWKQIGGGKIGDGIANNPDLQKTLGQIVGEMKALSPALLAGGESFAVEGTQVRGRVFGDAKAGRYLLLVNGSGEAAEVKASHPSLAKRRVGKTVVGAASVSLGGGAATASLPAYAVVVVELK